jgi:hypothetical protein
MRDAASTQHQRGRKYKMLDLSEYRIGGKNDKNSIKEDERGTNGG